MCGVSFSAGTAYWRTTRIRRAAFHAMRERDLERLRHFYEKAFLKGAYPPWLLELGRNMLDGCDRDADTPDRKVLPPHVRAT